MEYIAHNNITILSVKLQTESHSEIDLKLCSLYMIFISLSDALAVDLMTFSVIKLLRNKFHKKITNIFALIACSHLFHTKKIQRESRLKCQLYGQKNSLHGPQQPTYLHEIYKTALIS